MHAKADHHLRALAGIADCIGQQVLHDRLQRRHVERVHQHVGRIERQFHAARHRRRRQQRQFVAHRQRDVDQARFMGRGAVDLRQRQQLADQARGAFDCAVHVALRVKARWTAGRGRQHPGLGRNNRQRRAQFVGGVLHEATLGFELAAQLGQQPVDGAGQRRQFGIHGIDAERMQIVRPAGRDRLRQLAKRPQAARHRQPDRHQHQHEGDQQVAAHVAADFQQQQPGAGRFLADGDEPARRSGAHHAQRAALMQGFGRSFSNWRRIGQQHQHAALALVARIAGHGHRPGRWIQDCAHRRGDCMRLRRTGGAVDRRQQRLRARAQAGIDAGLAGDLPVDRRQVERKNDGKRQQQRQHHPPRQCRRRRRIAFHAGPHATSM